MRCLIKVVVFGDFCENGSKDEKFDFDEFVWINEVVVLS